MRWRRHPVGNISWLTSLCNRVSPIVEVGLATTVLAIIVVFAMLGSGRVAHANDANRFDVDTALILAVDVSDSVDSDRYRLQMEGIARALEDPGVVDSITGGPKAGIMLMLVSWSDRAEIALDWQTIRSAHDAAKVGGMIRQLPQRTGEYTCASRMLSMVKETIVPGIPKTATRIVLDVSGDGIDNCRRVQETSLQRDELVALGVTINGLPIIVAGENDVVGAGAYRAPGFGLDGEALGPGTSQTSLDAWYREHVIGGRAAFLLAANGYEDFGRAFRQKFVTEISSAD